MEWISVNDRLPEDQQRVLCVGRRGGIQICLFEAPNMFWTAKQNYANPTHWMALPTPPRGN